MFFCEKCRVMNKWPESTLKSYGVCESCGEETGCHDVPSAILPGPTQKKPKKERKERKKKETFDVSKYMLVVYAGGPSPDVETFDSEQEMLDFYAEYVANGTACKAYATTEIQLELTARRKVTKTPK